MRSVCVYCGSNLGADPAFAEATRALAMAADPEPVVDGLQLA